MLVDGERLLVMQQHDKLSASVVLVTYIGPSASIDRCGGSVYELFADDASLTRMHGQPQRNTQISSRREEMGRAQAEKCSYPSKRPDASCPRKFSPTMTPPKPARSTLDNLIPLQIPRNRVSFCRVPPHVSKWHVCTYPA